MTIASTELQLPRPTSVKKVGCLLEYEDLARRRLPKAVFSFVKLGVEAGQANRANAAAFDDWCLIPKTLTGIQSPVFSTDLFGQTFTAPFGIAPMGSLSFGRYRGDLEMALGAASEGVPMVLSGASSMRMEMIREHAPESWFQAYMAGDRDDALAIARRVQAAGFKVLVLTVDVPVASNRFHYERLGFSLPLVPTPKLAFDALAHPRWLLGTALRTLLVDGLPYYENRGAKRGGPMFGASSPPLVRRTIAWDDLAVIRDAFAGKIVLKGVLSVDDAVRAAQAGVDGLVVSNHGGRQLDSAPPPLLVLEDIVAAAPRMPVMIDGGVRWGSDVLKAIALGARFVFVGRPFYYANALGGRDAVAAAIRMLKAEIQRNLLLVGAPDLDALNRSWIMRRRPLLGDTLIGPSGGAGAARA